MLEIRYAAGLFDGEGYVRVNEWAKPNSIHVRFNLFVGIGMTYRPIIEQLHADFGGHFYVNRHDIRTPGRRPQYVWNVTSSTAADFLRLIQPHAIVKRAEIDLALEFQTNIAQWRHKLGNQFRLHPEREAILAWRRDIARKISELKHLTFSPLVVRGPVDQ